MCGAVVVYLFDPEYTDDELREMDVLYQNTAGLQTKKSSKEPLAPIREKLRRQIIFLGAAE